MTTTANALRQNQRQADRFYCIRHPDGRLTGVVDGHMPYRCAPCHAEGLDTTLIERKSATKKFLLGEELPFIVEHNIAEKIGDRDAMTTALAIPEPVNIAEIDPTEEQLISVGEKLAKFMPAFNPDSNVPLPDKDKILAAQLVLGLGMHPEHFTVTERNVNLGDGKWGKVASLYINLTGREFITLKQVPNYSGISFRVLGEDERAAWRIPDDQVACWADLKRIHPDGQERVYKSDMGIAGGAKDAKQPVALANPQLQAIARATVRVHVKTVPLGAAVPTLVEGHAIVEIDGEAHEIDTTTGELEEGHEGMDASDGNNAAGSVGNSDDGIGIPDSDGASASVAPHEYAWPEAEGVRKEKMTAEEGRDLVDACKAAGFYKYGDVQGEEDETNFEWFEFPNGETGLSALTDAALFGYRPEQIVEAMRAQNPQQAAMDMGEEVEELPW